MIKTNASTPSEQANAVLQFEPDDRLLLIDDAVLVNSYADASNRLGMNQVCARCFDPTQALRALLLLLDTGERTGEVRGALGLCRECYRDLAELMFHHAVLRAPT